MPELRARYGRPERPFGAYQFSEAERPRWEAFWRSVDGDCRRAYKYAKNAKLTNPQEFVGALHRFLFFVWPGFDFTKEADDSQKKTAARGPKDFRSYVLKVADEHFEEPLNKDWYLDHGCTRSSFVEMLRRVGNMAAEDENDEDEFLVAQVNARVPELGHRLYEKYLLMVLPGAESPEQIGQELLHIASAIEEELERI